MQIDCEIQRVKKYRILGPVCCNTMEILLRTGLFDSYSGRIKVLMEGNVDAQYWKFNFCPFCGEKIIYSETR